MNSIIKQIELLSAQCATSKPPIAIVIRADLYYQAIEEFKIASSELEQLSFHSIPVLCDPVPKSVAMSQTEECMIFHDKAALSLYLDRGIEPLAWVQYCCEKANIPYPFDEEDKAREMLPRDVK
jgi:hypothetical protein